MLYLVPTPIGNLEDITFRSIRVLSEVDVILAEDTRTSSILLKHHQIDTPMRAYHAHNEHRVLDPLINQLKTGVDIALISDAGTPAISDPGFLLVREAVKNDIQVICLPGPTALIPAVAASGIPCDTFHYEGFLPHKKGRQTRWKYLQTLKSTIVLYESPYRLEKCLIQALEFLGDRQAVVCRELSKIHEEYARGSITTLIEKVQSNSLKSKGEIVIVIAAE